MDFFINRNAQLPIMKLELINDGRNDYKHFMEYIQNAEIFFCMSDIKTGIKKIAMQPAACELKKNPCNGDNDCGEEYYLVYRWRERDTKVSGTYVGQFHIIMHDDLTVVPANGIIPNGELIVPIHDELKIHILDGSIKK